MLLGEGSDGGTCMMAGTTDSENFCIVARNSMRCCFSDSSLTWVTESVSMSTR